MLKSKVRIWDINKLAAAVKVSYNYSDVCRYLNIPTRGNNIKTIKKHVATQNLDVTHFKSLSQMAREKFLYGNPFHSTKFKNDSDVFIVGKVKTGLVKKRLKKYKVYKCELCSLPDTWQEKPLVLHLDHINGNSLDNRLENLRFLCPNCHSQTDTYSGKKSKKITDPNWRSHPRPNKRKVEWPSKEELEQLLKTHSKVAIAKQYGVSDVAVRKWAKQYNLL